MDNFTAVLNAITDEKHRKQAQQLLGQILHDFPELDTVVKWKQAMFTHEGTFILALNFSKKHFSIAPEKKALDHFSTQLEASPYTFTDNIIKIAWEQRVDYLLIVDLINFNLTDKKGYAKFWRE